MNVFTKKATELLRKFVFCRYPNIPPKMQFLQTEKYDKYSFKPLYLITCFEFSYDPPNVWFGWQRCLYSFTYDIVTANH